MPTVFTLANCVVVPVDSEPTETLCMIEITNTCENGGKHPKVNSYVHIHVIAIVLQHIPTSWLVTTAMDAAFVMDALDTEAKDAL